MNPQNPYQSPNQNPQNTNLDSPAQQQSVGIPQLQTQQQVQSQPYPQQPQPLQQLPRPLDGRQASNSYNASYQQYVNSQQDVAPVSQSVTTDNNQPEYSIDYLNKISPNQNKSENKLLVLGSVFVTLLVVIAAVIGFVFGGSGMQTDSSLSVYIMNRSSTLTDVTKTQTNRLIDLEINQLNAALSSVMSSVNADITKIVKEKKYNGSSSKKATTQEREYLQELNKILEDAHQKGTLDRKYVTQMQYELGILNSKLTRLKNTTDSKSMKEFCDKYQSSIKSIMEKLETANESSNKSVIE